MSVSVTLFPNTFYYSICNTSCTTLFCFYKLVIYQQYNIYFFGKLVDYSKEVLVNNITDIFEILKAHENDLTDLRIHQGHMSGK
jgi:hypothetical protein